jgi:hydroxyacylglutathione hydrolase
LEAYPKLEVFGSKIDEILGLTNGVEDGDEFNIGDLKVQVLFTPCHTKGHVLYLVSSEDKQALFSGDTLFSAGCGRFFEGDATQMQSAMDKIAKLSDSTDLYCGHEYTLGNLQFALTVEESNKSVVMEKLQNVLELLENGKPTVPSTLGEEKTYNPFMRTNVESMMKSLKKSNPVDAMHKLRELKNDFKPPKKE